MFDANLRYLEQHDQCIVDVYEVQRQSKLYRNGVRKGDLLPCLKLSGENDFTTAEILLPTGKRILVSNQTPRNVEWLVYHGGLHAQ